MTHLHIFALNESIDLSHTHLTRQKGEAVVLPPLSDWLGVESIDTDEIELFPVSDLGDMTLSDYIQLAFTPEAPIPAATAARLNTLDGGVLMVPDNAMTGTPAPGPQATEIASIALARADHDAELPKARVTPMPTPAPEPQREKSPPIALIALIAMAVIAAIIVFVGWS
ncbi:hypothetical protein [Gymnodinialimonas ceratoperidinii]|uniref:Uncharacterized protein n=1 Tax=Gymnodinialimonas ceratoperidinii TaxID=2856823 RepID=A0A8F6TX84_9RHOB|nr:hypothetical protein [Gymnodinialimonas ceratoperidinii]QXT40340.1 hypothetical protein KYE46_03565 [Gymnodinialimonas ceratoperidinii]